MALSVTNLVEKDDAVARATDWSANPYLLTNPKHSEYEREERADAVERLGTNVSKLMRVADFKAELYNHDITAAHRLSAARRAIKANHTNGESLSAEVSPSRPNGEADEDHHHDGHENNETGAATAGAEVGSTRYHAVKPRGFRNPVSSEPEVVSMPTAKKNAAAIQEELDLQDKTLVLASPISHDTTQPGSSSSAAASMKAASTFVTCSAPLFSGQWVVYGTSDGMIHIANKATMSNAVHTEDMSLNFASKDVQDHHVTKVAKAEGVMGTDEQCSSGVWVSKHFHRAVRANTATATSPLISAATTAVVYPVALALSSNDTYVAAGMSDGSVHVWSFVNLQGIARIDAQEFAPKQPSTTTTTAAATQVGRVLYLRFLQHRGAATSNGESPQQVTNRILVFFANGTVALATFTHGTITELPPPPLASPTSYGQPCSFATAVPPSLTLFQLRVNMLRGEILPTSIALATDESCVYAANRSGELFVIDIDDLQLAMRCTTAEFLARCHVYPPVIAAPKKQKASHNSSNDNNKGTAASSLSLKSSNPIIVSIASLEAHLVLGLATGEAILIEKTKGTLTGNVYAVRHVHQLHDNEPVASLTMCPNDNAVISLIGGSTSGELVTWSLDADIAYTILRRVPLPAPVISSASSSSSFGASSSSSLSLDVAVFTTIDATELWTAGADGINFCWVSQFPRAKHEMLSTSTRVQHQVETNAIALIDWHVAVSRAGAETQLRIEAATDTQCRLSEADLYRRYYWKFVQFRLMHQLQRKYKVLSNILERSQVSRIGRDAFRKWNTYRNIQLKGKRQAHAANALAQIKDQIRMQGSMIVWERFVAMRRRTATLQARSVILFEAIQRRTMVHAYYRLRGFARLQKLRRRWSLFADTIAAESQRRIQRRALMTWFLFNQQGKVYAHKVEQAERLSNLVANKQIASSSLVSWKGFVESRQRRRKLALFAQVLEQRIRPLQLSLSFHDWVRYVYQARAKNAAELLQEAKDKKFALESTIQVRAPRFERFRKLTALKERLEGLQERMGELGEVQDGIADRVTTLRMILKGGSCGRRSGSPLFAGMESPPPTPGAGERRVDPQPPSTNLAAVSNNNGDASTAQLEEATEEEAAAANHFPEAMSRLKKRLLNVATDHSLITQVVERSHVQQPLKFFHSTLNHLERQVRKIFKNEYDPTASVNHSPTNNNVDLAQNNSPGSADFTSNALGDATLWVPEEATEVTLRSTMISLAQDDPAAAQQLLRDVVTLVVAYDCMPASDRRNGVVQRMKETIVHHEDVLEILHDALLRRGVTTHGPSS